MRGWAANLGFRSYHPDGNNITPGLVQKVRQLGLDIGAWRWTLGDLGLNRLSRASARYALVVAPEGVDGNQVGNLYLSSHFRSPKCD